ncbi:Sporulation-delaying protein SdpB [Corynebacterium belfantii]|nr:Sporulation-delaying protein SdpB [Corynebacterium belfantii]
MPDGGDFVAIPATMALVLLGLSDRRLNHWHAVKAQDSFLGFRSGIGVAAAWCLRFQVPYIYLNAAVSKLFPEEWQTGTAFCYVTKSEMFGVSSWLEKPVDFMVQFLLVTIIFTWGTILFEASVSLIFIFWQQKVETHCCDSVHCLSHWNCSAHRDRLIWNNNGRDSLSSKF